MTNLLLYHITIYLVLALVGFFIQYHLHQQANTDISSGWTKFIYFNGIIVMVLMAFHTIPNSILWIHLTISVLGLYELYNSRFLFTFILTPLFLGLNYTFLIFSPIEIANTLLLTATFDGYSQLTGKLWGRHKLLSSISPKKTIQGALGGTVMTYLVASLLYYNGYSSDIGFLVLLPVFAATGDLGASFVKRKSGIKDFSNLLPGQGGILDRFDSYIATMNGMLFMYFITK